eukprot:665430-Heterocapsa_arctica.AAC.1
MRIGQVLLRLSNGRRSRSQLGHVNLCAARCSTASAPASRSEAAISAPERCPCDTWNRLSHALTSR